MISEPFSVSAFGRDCNGNCTGWLVARYVWRPMGNPYRADGLNMVRETVGVFVGDIYKPDQRKQAHSNAARLCAWVNATDANAAAALAWALGDGHGGSAVVQS